jgi:hypothetical protein
MDRSPNEKKEIQQSSLYLVIKTCEIKNLQAESAEDEGYPLM